LIVKPNVAAFHNNLGFSYSALGRFDEAMHHFREALRLQPDFAMAFNNMGKVAREQAQVAEAMGYYDQALALQPDYVEAHFNRAELRLLMGDFEQGWHEYEWRWQLPQVGGRATPRWGGSALAGKTIVLHAEQGLGDTIHFIRYAPLLKERGAKVIIHCQHTLLRLLESAPCVDGRVAWHTTLPPFDVQEHLLDVPGVFGTNLTTIPSEVPYLSADHQLTASWRQKLQACAKSEFLIGIAWKGSAKNQSDRKRSVPLACFEALAKVPGVRLISLQKGPGTEQIGEVAGSFNVQDLGSDLDEAAGGFMDSAAVLMSLDLVISCDTAAVHLAGALGIPCWVALPLSPDWRWLLEREDSPWYPSLRLFRQERVGEWDDVMRRMAEEVGKVVSPERN
jgi:hypothetical protein